MGNIGSSPKVKRVRYAAQSADPVSPQEGDVFRSDGTVRTEGLWEYRQSSWQFLAPSRAGILQGDSATFDGTVGDWNAYADAAGTLPVDGTGGSPTLTVTRTTSAPLKGTGSLLLTKDTANRQGEGASLDLSVDPQYRGQPMRLSFTYEGNVNFDFGDAADPVGSPSDLSMFFYDVTNSKLLTPTQTGIFGGGVAQTDIQIPTTCASIRVILHVATTNGTAWTFKADDFKMDLATNETSSDSSDWVAYTPTFSGSFGTTGSVDFIYRRNGKNLEVEGTFQTGTVTAAVATVSLPAGLTTDSSVPVNGSNKLVVGQLVRATAGGVPYHILADASATVVNFGIQDGTYPGTVARNASQLSGNNEIYTLSFSVPIEGWTSGAAHPAATGLNSAAVFVGNQTSESLTASITNITLTSSKDNVGGWATNIYTVQTPGDYLASISGNGTTAMTMGFWLNGTNVGRTSSADSSGRVASGSFLFEDLKYGDQISFRSFDTTTLANADASIVKLNTGSQAYAPKVAYIKDLKSSGTNGGTFTSGAWQTRDLNTLEGDETFISLSSNAFTLQPGKYEIDADACAYFVAQHKAKLRNTSDSSDVIIGSAEYTSNGASDTPHSTSKVKGIFSISSAKTFELQHRCTKTQASNGFGGSASYSVDELYTQIKITKLL